MTEPTALSIVLTGGATGIGAATLARLEAQGHQVTILDIVQPAVSVSYIQCDLSDPAAIDRAIAQLPGQIDRLFNVAGVSNAAPDEKILQVNFLSLRYLTEQLVPRISDGGCVVNVASSAGYDWRNRQALIDGLLDTPTLMLACGGYKPISQRGKQTRTSFPNSVPLPILTGLQVLAASGGCESIASTRALPAPS